jgi:hypothetical protein
MDRSERLTEPFRSAQIVKPSPPRVATTHHGGTLPLRGRRSQLEVVDIWTGA